MTRLFHFVGVGGQGVLSAARFLGEAAFRAGREVTVSQLHGMSARGGAVQATVWVGEDAPMAPARGAVDVLIGFEMLEVLRAAERVGAGTTLLCNRRTLPPQNLAARAALAPTAEEIADSLRPRALAEHLLDASQLAEAAGGSKVLNVVMLGALSALPICPVSAEALESAVRAGCSAQAWPDNQRAYALGREAVLRLT